MQLMGNVPMASRLRFCVVVFPVVTLTPLSPSATYPVADAKRSKNQHF